MVKRRCLQVQSFVYFFNKCHVAQVLVQNSPRQVSADLGWWKLQNTKGSQLQPETDFSLFVLVGPSSSKGNQLKPNSTPHVEAFQDHVHIMELKVFIGLWEEAFSTKWLYGKATLCAGPVLCLLYLINFM